jgi:hypothetical protein
MADLIRRFVRGDVGRYEWDDFMGASFDDASLDAIRLRATGADDRKAAGGFEYGSEQSDRTLLALASQLDEMAGAASGNDRAGEFDDAKKNR